MSQVISQGFVLPIKVTQIDTFSPVVNKDKTVFYIPVSCRNVSMVIDDVVGYKELVESFTVRIDCESLEDLKNLSEFLLKNKSTSTPLYFEIFDIRQEYDLVSIKGQQPFVNLKPSFNVKSVHKAKDIYTQDVKNAVELNKTQAPKA